MPTELLLQISHHMKRIATPLVMHKLLMISNFSPEITLGSIEQQLGQHHHLKIEMNIYGYKISFSYFSLLIGKGQYKCIDVSGSFSYFFQVTKGSLSRGNMCIFH